jgi:hypothetical protein
MFSKITHCYLDVSPDNMRFTILAVFSLIHHLIASDPSIGDLFNISSVEGKQSKWNEFENKISQLESII